MDSEDNYATGFRIIQWRVMVSVSWVGANTPRSTAATAAASPAAAHPPPPLHTYTSSKARVFASKNA